MSRESNGKERHSRSYTPPFIFTLVLHDDFGRIICIADTKRNERLYVVHQWTREDQKAFRIIGTYQSRDEADEHLLGIDSVPGNGEVELRP